MGYIKDSNHFINYIKKSISYHEDFDVDELLDFNFYVKEIYDTGIADKFSWMLKGNIELLKEENVLEFIGKEKSVGGSFDITDLKIPDYILEPAREFLRTLNGVPGVYIFESGKKKPLYVGMSTNLLSRIPSSFNERFKEYNKQVFIKCILCESSTDAAICEIYSINKLKPVFNSQSKFNDVSTVEVLNIPKYTDRYRCK